MKIVLVIAYLSMYGAPDITVHDQPNMQACKQVATDIFNRVRAGSVRVWCAKVISV